MEGIWMNVLSGDDFLKRVNMLVYDEFDDLNIKPCELLGLFQKQRLNELKSHWGKKGRSFISGLQSKLILELRIQTFLCHFINRIDACLFLTAFKIFKHLRFPLRPLISQRISVSPK